jgi:hypothetical protein
MNVTCPICVDFMCFLQKMNYFCSHLGLNILPAGSHGIFQQTLSLETKIACDYITISFVPATVDFEQNTVEHK